MAFKVSRLTARFPLQQPNNAVPAGNSFFYRVPGGAELPTEVSAARVAAIIETFNTGRDCFYDDAQKIFSTDPSSYWQPYPQANPSSGMVAGWDVRIPATGDCQIRLMVRASGEPFASQAVILTVADDQLAIALAVARSAQCYYDEGVLRAFDFTPANVA